jgi:hypothetical protein
MKKLLIPAVIGVLAIMPPTCRAANVEGGTTSVLLDTATLASAAGLTLSSVSSEVISPGTLAGSVAFPITPRSATPPTTFTYDPATFPASGSFSGAIEHVGSVFFNADAVEVGDFTIGFDAARVGTLGGQASGFFVESNVGVAAILFDVGVTGATALPASLDVSGNLLVSPELGAFLLSGGLATVNLQGADVGDALVEAVAVPEPSAAAMTISGLTLLAAARRRR